MRTRAREYLRPWGDILSKARKHLHVYRSDSGFRPHDDLHSAVPSFASRSFSAPNAIPRHGVVGCCRHVGLPGAAFFPSLRVAISTGLSNGGLDGGRANLIGRKRSSWQRTPEFARVSRFRRCVLLGLYSRGYGREDARLGFCRSYIGDLFALAISLWLESEWPREPVCAAAAHL